MNTSDLEQALLQALKEMTSSPFVELSGHETHLKKIALLPSKTTFSPQNVLLFLEHWTSSKTSPFCAILGEYGMGKTTACLWFARRLLEKRSDNPALPLPIYLDLRALISKSFSDHFSLDEIIELILKNSFFKDPGYHHLINPKMMIQLVQQGQALAIFDGLDEVLVHLSISAGQNFTRTLMNILPSSNFKKAKGSYSQVLLSCRTHFFRTLREQKTHFTQEDRASIRPEDFLAIELLPFNENQVQQYFSQTLPEFDKEALFALIRSVHNLSELTERPYTLSLIPELIPYIEQWKQENRLVTSATIYNRVVQSWFEKDIDKHTLTLEHKRCLMEELAAALWRSGEKNWRVIRLEQWLAHFLHDHPSMLEPYTVEQQLSFSSLLLEIIKEDVRTATFLVRTGEDSFRFAHTSLQEFFLASHLYRGVLEHNQSAWDLPLVNQEILHFLGQLLAERQETIDLSFFTGIHSHYHPRVSEQVFSYLIYASKHGYPAIPIEGMCLKGAHLSGWKITGQAGQLLSLKGIKFQQANLEEAHLSYLNLDDADFSETNLQDAELYNNQIRFANFVHTNLHHVKLRDSNLEFSNFEHAKLHRTRFMQCNLAHALNFSQDNNNVYIYSLPGSTEPCSTHHTPDKEEIKSIEPLSYEFSQCSFSFDGQFLAASSFDHTIHIWNIQTGERTKLLIGHQDRVRNCAFSPDYKYYLISTSNDKTLRVWDTQTGICLQTLTGHDERAKGCAFSPDGNYAATASKDKTLRLWDIQKAECIKILKGHTDILRGCAYSPDGKQIISSSEDTTLRLWDTATGKCLKVFQGHQSWVQGCSFSADGRQVLSASGDKTLRLWDINTEQCIRVFQGHQKRVRECAFITTSSTIVSCADDATLRIWNIDSGKCSHILEGHEQDIKGCAYSPAVNQIASASADGTVRLWDAETGQCLKIFQQTSLVA